ncbi:phytochelatin synthase [Micromonospora rosaria]|uniref:Phytochelatin synthase n=1 Tax=Micromonospora rosaria TaxID=47874 RepID=A0A136PL79_9ACTN|nr:C39 family peptidase [Micromonospora rosaria]KXK59103.1 phytochelatin synthase [Micromonospora rosaria]
MNTIFRNSALSLAGLLVAGGAVAVPALAAQTTPAERAATSAVQADRPARGERVLGIQYEAQPNFYYCGPAATRIALSALGTTMSQDEVATKLGTTEAGTDSAEETTRVLSEVTGERYRTTEISGDRAAPAQAERFRADVVTAVDDGRAVVANIKGSAVDVNGNPYSYEGGHYVTVVGYRDGGNTVKIADPYAPSEQYWMDATRTADWIAQRGYSS